MNTKLVEEAPYHPGYEDVGFKEQSSRLIAEIDSYRLSNARYLNFAEVIVRFCANENGNRSFQGR